MPVDRGDRQKHQVLPHLAHRCRGKRTIQLRTGHEATDMGLVLVSFSVLRGSVFSLSIPVTFAVILYS